MCWPEYPAIDDDNEARCIQARVNTIQTDNDAGLPDFTERHFNYVIMTQTLQAVHYPDRLLEEMYRVMDNHNYHCNPGDKLPPNLTVWTVICRFRHDHGTDRPSAP